jgi:hypothetical protein
MGEWRIELFGGLAILKDGIPTAQAVASRATTTNLLALLALEKGRGIEADTLAARLWPDATPWHAQKSLYAATSRLRAALGDFGRDIMVREGTLCRIDTAKVTTDVADFDRLARTVTFADALDDGVKAALSEIEGVYKGDLLGRGEPCRNQVLRAYNTEYRTRIIGVWEVAAELYLERGGSASRVKAEWYAENIRRIEGLEAADTRATQKWEALGEALPARRQGKQEPLLRAPRPSVRAQLAEGRGKLAEAAPSRRSAQRTGHSRTR